MNLSRRWTFLLLLAALSLTEAKLAQAQSIMNVPEGPLSDQYFTKQMLNDEEWNDSKLFPSINPKSRAETDPTYQEEDYLRLPWYARKSQVAQLIAGIFQYRVLGLFHHRSRYYAKMYQKWTERTPIKFNYLKIHSNRYQPRIEDSLTFINSLHEYRGISDKAIGYCYGVSDVFKKFTQLAFFSENIAPEDQVPEKGTDEWFDYYLERLGDVVNGDAAFFPGFKNLRELTMVPEFEFFLKVQVTKQWKRLATLRTTLASYWHNTDEMDADEVHELVTNLKKRLKRGEFPKISFASAISKTFLTGGARTHVVLATKVEELPEQKITRIHIWDIDFYAEDLVKRPYFLEIKYDDEGTPTTRYQEWANPSHDTKRSELRTEIPGDRIGKVLVSGENNEEVVDTIDSLEEFCAAPPAGHPEIKTECDRAQSLEEL